MTGPTSSGRGSAEAGSRADAGRARVLPQVPGFGLLLRAVAAVHRRLWLLRATTLGARIAVFDEAGRILLVRHAAHGGWFLPGGGVDRGETAAAAAVREAREETGVLCLEPPVLHGFYFNAHLKHDHIACYVVRACAVAPDARLDWEIAEAAFFAPDALPPDTSAATRRRLAEIAGTAPVAALW